MWKRTYSYKVKGIKAEHIWQVWTDINQWHIWQDDLDYAKLVGRVEVGNKFILKPKGGPKFTIEFTEVTINKSFSDMTSFLLAKMHDTHELIEYSNGEIEIKSTVSITGILSFVWRKIVAEKIANEEPNQTQKLIERVNTLFYS